MAQDRSRLTRDLIERLHEQGHHTAAQRLSRAVESGVLFSLRETLETLLTAIEAIDPVTQTMIEELRVEVEKLLQPPKASKENR